MPGPRVEPVGVGIFPRLSFILTTSPSPSPIELRLKRFPHWVMAAVLPWLPVVLLLFFFTVPRREALVCENGSCTLEVAKGISRRSEPVHDVRFVSDSGTSRRTVGIETIGPNGREMKRYALDEPRDIFAPTVVDRYNGFNTSGTRVDEELLGSAWWKMFLGIVVLELALGVYFLVAQRELLVTIDARGQGRIVEQGLFAMREGHGDFALPDVDVFEVDGTLIAAQLKAGERKWLVEAKRFDATRVHEFLAFQLQAFRVRDAKS